VSYTALALAGVAFALALDLLVLRTRLVARRAFWVAYAIIIVFQLISNGILTYRDVVRYNPSDILGFRIVGAPLEDLLFGFSLVLQTLSWWVWWGRRWKRPPGPSLRPSPGEPSPPATGPALRPPSAG
jgi:lycopene cyclase domain-containing protein